MDSILNSVKKVLGVDAAYTVFDTDIIMHINSALSVLTQLGIGPTQGFMVEDSTSTWAAFLGDDIRLNMAKSVVYLRVRMLFDPPQTSYLVTALEKQIEELEWRLNVHRESTQWINPDPTVLVGDVVFDGGAP